jgi:hypothetical protein
MRAIFAAQLTQAARPGLMNTLGVWQRELSELPANLAAKSLA